MPLGSPSQCHWMYFIIRNTNIYIVIGVGIRMISKILDRE